MLKIILLSAISDSYVYFVERVMLYIHVQSPERLCRIDWQQMLRAQIPCRHIRYILCEIPVIIGLDLRRIEAIQS